MNKKALQILEFDKIKDNLSKEASTPEGKSKCQSLTPESGIDEIETLLCQTEAAVSRIFADGSVSFSGAYNVDASMKRLDVGGILSIEDLLRISSLLAVTKRVKAYDRARCDRATSSEEAMDCLSGMFDLLEPLSNISSEIDRCIISENEIADDASSGLKNVRRQIKAAGDKIHNQLMQLLNGSLRNYLQDAVITMRGDRYCLPVKAEYKSQVPGMIHDQSSTGSTLFIEPASVVKLNNDLKELMLLEDQEIEKVLLELSNICRPYIESITCNHDTLVSLDFIFARGRLAIEMNATKPIYNTDGIINLRKARHPLLDSKKVVPVDIRLGDEFSLLIVTGPNTGGKTVSLKTAGLLSLMGQSGLFIPAGDRSQLSVFTQIYADIGDEQSIEQSLSTFSSHMKNIIYILKNADKSSLCLFDELCAGTDPTEGAALAIAILRNLHDRGSKCMATTHYSELKVFALSEEGVENACCEFDVNTLSPTYRLLIGVPGKSNAFAISSKLGLPQEIIDQARENVGESDKSFEDVITELEQSRIALEKEREKAEDFKRQAQSLKDKTRSQSEKLENSRERILEEARAQAREILQEAKNTADETIRNFQKYGSIDQIREMEKDRERIRSNMKKTTSRGIAPKKSDEEVKRVDPSSVKKGDSVRVISMNVTGSVVTLPDNRGNLFVQCGILRTQVNVKDLEAIADEPSVLNKQKSSVSGMSKLRMAKSSNVSSEINLIGKKVDEAISLLDKYLDDAYISHLEQVRIVHGKGTGALRNAVHQHLKRTGCIKEFHIAEYGEGDAGVTIAVFK